MYFFHLNMNSFHIFRKLFEENLRQKKIIFPLIASQKTAANALSVRYVCLYANSWFWRSNLPNTILFWEEFWLFFQVKFHASGFVNCWAFLKMKRIQNIYSKRITKRYNFKGKA